MKQYQATGRRKTSVARVRLVPGSGKHKINGRTPEDFIPVELKRLDAFKPLKVAGQEQNFDAIITVNGGGITGQSGAIKLGIARALVSYDETLRDALKDHHLLTRDPRMVERKKYGRKKARKRFQFSKR